MEGSANLTTIYEGDFSVIVPGVTQLNPPLLLLPSWRADESVYQELFWRLYLEEFVPILFVRPRDWDDVLKGFSRVREFFSEGLRRFGVWVWGEGKGALWAFRLAKEFLGDVKGVVVDSALSEDKRDIEDLLRDLRKPHLIFHPQFDSEFPFSEMERMFAMCPAHAKKLLLVPGARGGDVVLKGGDLYVRTIAEFINPRIGRWKTGKKRRGEV